MSNNDTATQSDLLTKKQVGNLVHKSLRTVEAWMKLGYLPHIKVGKSVLFDRQAVLNHLAKYQVGASTTN